MPNHYWRHWRQSANSYCRQSNAAGGDFRWEAASWGAASAARETWSSRRLGWEAASAASWGVASACDAWEYFDQTSNWYGVWSGSHDPWYKRSRRADKLGKAFPNYRRAILQKLRGAQLLKRALVAWQLSKRNAACCPADWIWNEDDMSYFLMTKASFEEHAKRQAIKRKERKDPGHKDYGKDMPRCIPPSYIRVFQLTLVQTYDRKFKQHFGNASMNSILHTPYHLLKTREMLLKTRKIWEMWGDVAEDKEDEVAESVAEGAAAEAAEKSHQGDKLPAQDLRCRP